MEVLGKGKKGKSGTEGTAPSSGGPEKGQALGEKSPDATSKKGGAYLEVRAATGTYRKAGYAFGVEVQTLYECDLSKEQIAMLVSANPKALVVKRCEG